MHQLLRLLEGDLGGLCSRKKRDLILKSQKEDIVSSAIHMFFMLYPLDVLWVNSSKAVVDLKKSVPYANPLKPKSLRIYKPRGPARYVIELGVGSIGRTEIGDKLEFPD
ncbi:MAG: DUF192 domain-containing protein [Candidatus Altiarchaeota archaeon]